MGVVTASGATTLLRSMRAQVRNRALASYVALFVLFGLAALVNPRYAGWDSVRNILQVGSFIGIVAIGQTLVIITGQIDLSTPWNLTFSSILMATMLARGYDVGTAVAVALACGVVVGAFNSLGTSIFRVHSLVWTLGVGSFLEGLTLVFTHGQPPSGIVPNIVRTAGSGLVHGLPIAFVIWMIFAAATLVLLHCTRFGRYLYAIGNNETALFLSGVNSRITYLIAFIVSGLCAAVAGVMITGYSSQTFLGMGDGYLLVPIAAVVIGGTNVMGGSGGYVGTIAGCLIVVLLQSVLGTVQISQAGKDVLFGAIVAGAVLAYGRRDWLG